ncbi:hypothetical protein QNM99_29985 [Pseudomonas sp. PCH446]
MNTWVSFQSAEQPLLGQFSVSGNTQSAEALIEGVADLVLTGDPGRDWILIKTLLYGPASLSSSR